MLAWLARAAQVLSMTVCALVTQWTNVAKALTYKRAEVETWCIITSQCVEITIFAKTRVRAYHFEKRGSEISVKTRRILVISMLGHTVSMDDQRITDALFNADAVWKDCTISLYRIYNMFVKAKMARQKVLALAMGTHVRLGTNSLLRLLSADNVRLIAAQLSKSLFDHAPCAMRL